MGWLFSPSWNRKSLIQERIESWNSKDRDLDNPNYVVATCLKHCYRGNAFFGVLWTVWEHKLLDRKNDKLIKIDKWIGCDLLKCENYNGTKEWGYKDMEESCGPNYCSCPLSYLELAPCTNVNWRRQVRIYHARRNIKLKIGQVVKLKEGYEPQSDFRIVSIRPLKGVCINENRIYRLQKKAIQI